MAFNPEALKFLKYGRHVKRLGKPATYKEFKKGRKAVSKALDHAKQPQIKRMHRQALGKE